MKFGIFGIIFDKKKRVLLCHRRDIDLWNLPGGGLKEKESPWEGIKREVKEETGLNIETIRISNIYFKSKEKELVFCFICKIKSGKIKINEEAEEIKYFEFKKLPKNTAKSHIQRIKDALARINIEGIMEKIVLDNKNLIAPCGLYCGECSGFQDGLCEGCLSRKGLCLKYTKICKIYSCCTNKKKLRFCSDCKDFPCGKFTKFFNTSVWYNEVVDNLKKVKKIGAERFSKEQVKRVEGLIKCANKRGIKHCSQCKEWPCGRLKRPPLVPE